MLMRTIFLFLLIFMACMAGVIAFQADPKAALKQTLKSAKWIGFSLIAAVLAVAAFSIIATVEHSI